MTPPTATLAECLVTVAADVARLGVPEEAMVVVDVTGVRVSLVRWAMGSSDSDNIAKLDAMLSRSPGLWVAEVERERISRGGEYRLRGAVNGVPWVVAAGLSSDASVDMLTARLADTAAAGAA